MKTVLQRVSEARVHVDQREIASIETGMVSFLGVEKGDDREDVKSMADRMLTYRIFPDEEEKMNLDLQDISGDLLVIPNFTLCAETSSGTRPGFGPAASPDRAEELYEHLVSVLEPKVPGTLGTGEFGAMMDVSLVNDGPVTFIFEEA